MQLFQKKIVIALIVEMILFAAIVVITMTVLHGTKKRSALIGIICIVFNVLMYTSPLTVMVRMIWSWIQSISLKNSILLFHPNQILFHLFFFFFVIQRRVISTKSVKYMPFYLSLANFANGCVWFCYAFIKFDPYVLVTLSSIFNKFFFNFSFRSSLKLIRFFLPNLKKC